MYLEKKYANIGKTLYLPITHETTIKQIIEENESWESRDGMCVIQCSLSQLNESNVLA